jgi:hypothetical protein
MMHCESENDVMGGAVLILPKQPPQDLHRQL